MKKIYNRFFSSGVMLKGVMAAFMLAPLLSFGQLTYTIGTGTSVNTQYSYPTPFGNYYDGMREQFLFTKSELNAAGFAAGSISAIAFEVQATNSIATLTNYTVYIQTTNATSLSSSFLTMAGGPVFQSNLTVSVGWNTLVFSTPFIWNGQDNIIIQVCFENSCSSWTGNAAVYYSVVTFDATLDVHNDCTSGMCTNSGTPYNTKTYRPNIRFTVIPPVVDDAGVAEIVSPSVGMCQLGNMPVKVVLNNMGSDSMTSCTVNWSVNGSLKTPFSFTGNVAKNGGKSDTVTLGSHTFFDGDTLIVWTSDPNGVQDSFPNNDTLMTGVFEALGGVYTIGGTSPDYVTIKDAVDALMARGVCADVDMQIRQGTYNTKVLVGPIPGAKETATITFTSDPQNTSVVEIAGTPDATDNYVVKYANTSWVTFENITIDGSAGTGGYAVVVDFNGASHCVLTNCILNGIPKTSYTYPSTEYTINGTGGDYISIIDNEVNYGYYSVYWSGGEEIEMTGNEFLDAYYYGLYLTTIDELKFNNNKLSALSAYIYNYGLYAYKITGASEFIGNFLSWPGYMATYFSDITGSSSEQPIIANNMIHAGNGSYYAYGCYLYNCGYVNFVHNTVAKDVPSGYGYYGVYVYGGANKLINNIFYDPNGSSTYYNFYYSGAFAVSESDYNNVYSNQYFGYLNGVQSTLTAWQNNTGFDMHSTTIDPGFTNLDSMRHCNDSLDGTGTPLSYVSDDFDKDGRHPSTPDVGADEWIGSAPGSYSAGDDALVCEGKTATIGLSVTGGTFLWSTNDSTATISVSQEGTYTVTMTSSCGAQHSDTVEVVDVTPEASFDLVSSYLTGQFTNTSINGLSYMWVVNTIPADTFYGTDLTYIFLDNGPYNVDLYVYNDCDTVMITKEWKGFVGINESSLANNINLMPNPATDVLNIRFNGVDGDLTMDITNIQGQAVYSERFVNVADNSTKTINVSSLVKGMYIVKFTSDNEIATKQIIVQ